MSQRFRNRVLPFALLVLVLSAASAATAAVSNDSRPAAGATPPATQVGSVVISAVTVAGAGSALSVTNLGGDAVDLTGWFVCNAPGYWPLPARTLAAGESFTIHAGSGADTDTDVYAAGGFGSLDDIGEVALYTQPQFEDPGSIVAYVGWNGGKVRKGVAQAAGIWGDADVTLALGDTIVRTGSAPRRQRLLGRGRGTARHGLGRARRRRRFRRLAVGDRGGRGSGRSPDRRPARDPSRLTPGGVVARGRHRILPASSAGRALASACSR